MSCERVAAILVGYEAWNRGEPGPATEASPGFEVSPEFEFHPPADLPGEDVYVGEGATRAFMRAVGEVFEYLRISPVDVSERGEHVIVRVHLEASGRHSGVEVSRDEFHVFSFQGEVLRSFRAFTEEEAALGFAGVGREG